mgnify:CR=1 FL=1
MTAFPEKVQPLVNNIMLTRGCTFLFFKVEYIVCLAEHGNAVQIHDGSRHSH